MNFINVKNNIDKYKYNGRLNKYIKYFSSFGKYKFNKFTIENNKI